MCCAVGSGLVLASPASDSPLEFVLEVLVVLVVPEPALFVLLELLEPHAAIASAQAAVASEMSVSRNGRDI
jgi:hypothetical protein